MSLWKALAVASIGFFALLLQLEQTVTLHPDVLLDCLPILGTEPVGPSVVKKALHVVPTVYFLPDLADQATRRK